MTKLAEKPARQEVLDFLAHAASYGNLGLFIGAGFSKAVLSDGEEEDVALSWGRLLEKAAKRMQVDYGAITKTGLSYPEIASAICVARSNETRQSFAVSLRELKNEVARLTGWYPSSEQRSKYSQYLGAFNPSWIVTTNYDLVIEALLTGRSLPLGPNDPLLAPQGFVPVFHLHGVRTKPKEIIIAQEDYVTLFRPSEYRQIKLALTVKESTTLFLGYGLGDVNVLTALDWSRHVFRSKRGDYPNEIVQVLRKTRPRAAPYRDKNGIVILETPEIAAFFEEFAEARKKQTQIEEKERDELRKLAKKLSSADTDMIDRFIDDERYRTKVLKLVVRFAMYLVGDFISFVEKCIAETWKRSSPKGAFEGYNQNLKIILDTLTAFDFERFPPALFQTAAENLERVAPMIGDDLGQSYAANGTWQSRKAKLSTKILSELAIVARQYGYSRLKGLLKSASK